MAANPMHSHVVQLNPPLADPRDVALMDMARQLSTERSASRAVIAAVKTLESELLKARATVGDAQAESAELRADRDRQDIEIQHQRVMNFSLHSDLTDVRTALAQERAKPYWRRLLNR